MDISKDQEIDRLLGYLQKNLNGRINEFRPEIHDDVDPLAPEAITQNSMRLLDQVLSDRERYAHVSISEGSDVRMLT